MHLVCLAVHVLSCSVSTSRSFSGHGMARYLSDQRCGRSLARSTLLRACFSPVLTSAKMMPSFPDRSSPLYACHYMLHNAIACRGQSEIKPISIPGIWRGLFCRCDDWPDYNISRSGLISTLSCACTGRPMEVQGTRSPSFLLLVPALARELKTPSKQMRDALLSPCVLPSLPSQAASCQLPHPASPGASHTHVPHEIR